MPRTVILGAARTPFGRLGGGLASLPAPQLGIHAGSAALERAGVSPDQVGYVVMGEVLQAGVGMIPSRQVSAGVGCPVGVGSDTINKVCASGMRATAYGDLLIRSGDHDVVLTGGMESMSNAPYLVPKARFGYTMGDGVLVDHMTSDGLTSTFTHRIMAEENSVVSAEIGVLAGRIRTPGRCAATSARMAAQDAGHLADEIVAVTVPGRKGDTVVDADEGPRRDTSAERLAALRPVFSKDGATTAGNAPGVNDGAAALVLASEEWAGAQGLTPLARILSEGQVADDYPYLVRTPAAAARDGAGAGRHDRGRRRPVRDQRGLLLGGALDHRPARGRPRPLQRAGRRGRLRPSDRRLGSAPGRHAGAPAAATRRRHRAGGDLLRRGPGRRDADRGAAGMSEIRRITVVGAGQMGAGIAQTAAVGGFDVTLSDVAPRQLEQAVSGIEASLAKLTEKGRLDEATRDAALERIQTAAEPADADLLIEAATENVELKLRIFAQLDEVAGDGAILASNTSSIPITRLAAATKRPQQVVGMHFMNPVPLMQLVEVIRGLETSDETVDQRGGRRRGDG